MVVFATGRYLGEEDLEDRGVQSVYGIWDYGDDSDDAECLGQIIDRDTGALSYPKGVRLLRQEEADWRSTGLGEGLRTLTAHAADWTCSADPGGRPDPAVHAGWFFDLPGFVSGEIRMPGERVIRDPLLWDRRAVIVSSVPSVAPCESGGMSMVHELDACTGARLPRAALDYNADGRIDAGDHRMIEVRDEKGGMTQVPPTGVTAGGILNPPAVLRMPDRTRTKEIKIFSGSAGGAVQILEAPERRGVVSWREWTRD
jgi:type IV pilus assembly protein PilY1